MDPTYQEHMHHFQQILDNLLYDQVPEDGAIALFLRRELGAGSVYFPVSLATGQTLENPGDILSHYYLYSMHHDVADASTDIDTVLLDESTGMNSLIRKGKLALALFPSGPVSVHIQRCDTHRRNILLCTFTKPDANPRLPSDFFQRACSDLLAQWQALSHTFARTAQYSHDILADRLSNLLSDQKAEPPFFPTMLAKIDSRSEKRLELGNGTWKTNSLSFNCFLLDRCDILTSEYIRRMFRSGKTAYIDNQIHSTDPLVTAIVSVCEDFVHRIGNHPSSGTLVYARRNVAKGSYRGNPEHDTRVQRNNRTHPSLWSLLRSALVYLRNDPEHDDCALVTVWAGHVSESCDVSALPIGLVPGQRKTLLDDTANHPILKPQFYIKDSPKGRLHVTAVLPGGTEAAIAQQRALAEKLIRPLLIEAELTIPGASSEPKYPGPYTIKIEDTCVRIMQKDSGMEVAVIHCAQTNGQLTHILLLALAESDEGMVAYERIKDDIPRNRNGAVLEHHKVTEYSSKCLSEHGLKPIGLIEYVPKGWCWRLVPRARDVEIKIRKDSQFEHKEGVRSAQDIANQNSKKIIRENAKDRKKEARAHPKWAQLDANMKRAYLSFLDALGDDDRRDWCIKNNMPPTDFFELVDAALLILDDEKGAQ